jgi:hypothetical protein
MFETGFDGKNFFSLLKILPTFKIHTCTVNSFFYFCIQLNTVFQNVLYRKDLRI